MKFLLAVPVAHNAILAAGSRFVARANSANLAFPDSCVGVPRLQPNSAQQTPDSLNPIGRQRLGAPSSALWHGT